MASTIAQKHYEEFVAAELAIKEAKAQLKALWKDGERAASTVRWSMNGSSLDEKRTAIRATWEPYKQKITTMEISLAMYQAESDLAWDAYEKTR